MEKEGKDVNEVFFTGRRTTDFRFSHSYKGESFYVADFASERNSGFLDCIPVMISAGQRDILPEIGDGYVHIAGQFRSFNHSDEGRRRLILSVYAEKVEVPIEKKDFEIRNYIYLEGYVCKKTVYRTTPAGKKITDILMAVNRPDKGADYLPCISWGKGALYAAGFLVGERIWLKGRIQSRDYRKVADEGKVETRTAYEVSAFGVGRLGSVG
jgi:hypothetical protein